MESLSVGILQIRAPHGAEIAYHHAKLPPLENQESSAPLLRNH